ncbi:MAG: hypothetical protein H7836_11305 [Magnetococcus sp. YQC-3]
MKSNLLVLLSILLSGCALTYQPPMSLAPSSVEKISQPKDKVFNAAKRALVADGYQITNTDTDSGIISTAPRDMRLAPSVADCGTTMGIDYLKDNRTSTRIAMGVIVYANTVEVKATIQGEYKPGSNTQDITLSCVSKGILEQEMMRKIIAEANR